MSLVVFTARPLVSPRNDLTIVEPKDKQLAVLPNLERREVSSASIADDLRAYAGSRWPTLNHKGRRRELQKLLKLGERRVRSLYAGEDSAVPRGEETERINALIEERRVAERQAEYRALEARIAQVEALVLAIDEEFGRVHLDALRALALGQGHRPGSGGAGDGPDDDATTDAPE